MKIFLNACVCIYIYKIVRLIHSTHIYFVNINFYLDAINNLTALSLYIYILHIR